MNCRKTDPGTTTGMVHITPTALQGKIPPRNPPPYPHQQTHPQQPRSHQVKEKENEHPKDPSIHQEPQQTVI